MELSVSKTLDTSKICTALCNAIGYAGLTHIIAVTSVFLHHAVCQVKCMNPKISKAIMAVVLPCFFLINLVEVVFRAVITLPLLAVCIPLAHCIKNQKFQQFTLKVKLQFGIAILASIANISVAMYSQFKDAKTSGNLMTKNLTSIGKCLLLKTEIEKFKDLIERQKLNIQDNSTTPSAA